MSEITIRPTHTCFDDALDMLEARIRKDHQLASGSRLIVVHAICFVPEGPEVGKRFAHAWLEEDGEHAWQLGLVEGKRVEWACDARELEQELRVERTWRYTPREVWLENQRSCTYGPWVEELQSLCKGVAEVPHGD